MTVLIRLPYWIKIWLIGLGIAFLSATFPILGRPSSLQTMIVVGVVVLVLSSSIRIVAFMWETFNA